MSVLEIPVWKRAPFIRLLLPFSIGIIIAFYIKIPVTFCWATLCLAGCCCFALFFLPIAFQHSYYPINGILINLLLISTGMLLYFYKDISNRQDWFGHHLQAQQLLIAKLEEPLADKPKSYKTHASIELISSAGGITRVQGKIIIYFLKDSSTASLEAGYRIAFNKQVQRLRISGNPGAFNFADYAVMQGIYHQVFLSSAEFSIIERQKPGAIKAFIFDTRASVISVLRRYIPGKLASGLAEALLIGYKDDLDKDLLQSYSNTGVVHVIAISGLHLGLIYWLLANLFKLTGRKTKLRVFKPVIIVAGLWVFSLLAGASPSVLRSAIMFTFIVAGEASGRKTSIFNSLAASAFLLLCYNPNWLWDAGFQLSYIAVLSLVVYMQAVYNGVYVNNPLLDHIWKLTSVTLAAQILTFPLCIYLFHQFPNFFLFANLLAIPLSGIILLSEIFLVCISSIPAIAELCGKLIQWMIVLMNRFIQHVEALPFSTFQLLQLSLTELFLIYGIIIIFSGWISRKSTSLLLLALTFLAGLTAMHAMYLYRAEKQQAMIVYDIKGKAVEYINGRSSLMFTTAQVLKDPMSEFYFLKPSRIALRIRKRGYVTRQAGICLFKSAGRKIAIVQKQPRADQYLATDLLIITGNPALNLRQLFSRTSCRMVVFDGSNALWKITAWKTFCDQEKIRYWSVPEKGAFIINLNSLSFATP